MKISTELPPNFRDIQNKFGSVSTAVFCYGDTIYNPFNRNVTPDIEAHEEVHKRQQGDSPDVWWYRYLNDESFRYEQELEAYGTQYAFAKEHVKDGKLLEWLKDKMAEGLSGHLYGNMVSYGKAESAIRNYAKYKARDF